MSEDRLTDLEIKVAFIENTIAELDEVVQQLATQLGEFRVEITQMREQLPSGEKFKLEDEVPPHY